TGHIVMTGKSRYFGQDPASGLLYHTVDFSALTIPADGYVLQAAGKSSAPFSVRRNLYGRLKTDALLYFTHSLAGAPIKAEFARQAQPPLTRPAGHKNRPTRCFSGRDLRGTQWPGCDYTLTPKGGWYDAGDYGRYITSTGFSVWAMLNTYERQQNGPASERYAFSDGKLPIAEHFNGTSDLLDIARVGIEFMLSMQIPQGKRAFVPRGPQLPIGPLSLQLTDVGGLVHHKVHGKTFPPLPKRPHEDTQPQYLYPPSTAASLHLAAIGAQCARIWKDIDPEFSDTCLTAAIRAYQAATVFSDIYAHDVFDGGGGYTDDNVKDEFFWASTELFLTTKDESYYPKMITYRSGVGESLHRRDTHTEYVEYLGLMSILAQYDHRTPEADLPDYVHEARNGITAVSQAFLEQARTSAFSLPYDDPKYYWGSNANLLGRAMVLAYGYNINKNPEFKAGIIHITDYLLGRNPLKTSYISGYGQTSMKSPHHRFWAHTLDPNFPAPPPGVLSGGPNNVNFSDPVAATLRGKCTGQT
ncbi:MAG TPA: glycosyl hydrolase, partial [Hellea balneolensis]|nr:glycosyl hydrolase [Hellea balneolensis]